MRIVLTGLANLLMVLVLAPLCEGVLRKVTARVQSRQGPPLAQPYFDLLKLLGKEDLESGESPVVQRLASWLALAAVLTVALLLPVAGPAPLAPAADAFLLIYLLALCGVSTMLAGLAAGSTYSLLGMSREMMSTMSLEPLLALALVVGAVQQGSLRLDLVLSGGVYAPGRFPFAGLLMLAAVLLAFQALVGRLPFDIAEAETELMEGPLAEYSGPKLALFKLTQMAKLVVYGALAIALFVPWGSGLPAPLHLLAFLLKLFALVLAVTWMAATHARYRIDQAVRYYAGLLGTAGAALVLALYGY